MSSNGFQICGKTPADWREGAARGADTAQAAASEEWGAGEAPLAMPQPAAGKGTNPACAWTVTGGVQAIPHDTPKLSDT